MQLHRTRALQLLEEHINQDNLKKHCLATEAIMRHLARHLGEDEEKWAVTGLLHDLDFEETKENMSRHGLVSSEILAKEGLDEDSLQAIRAHNGENTNVAKESRLDFALSCAESITGLIVATTLVQPSKKISDLKVKSVVKRMKKKEFARAVSREDIMLCENLGLSLNDFALISIRAMQEISDELGL